MIRDDRQLDQAVEQLGRMYRALAALRRDIANGNPRQFALLSEGPVDEIAQLLQQIAAYTGVMDEARHETAIADRRLD
jgi:hypothetical protein